MNYSKILAVAAIVQTCFLLGCNESCENNIEAFRFPEDIELMASKKRVCDSSVNLWRGILNIEYDDKNYSLLNRNEKSKVLIDKRNDLVICFKSNESNNFGIIFNEQDNYYYGIEEIFFLEANDLLPLFSISNKGALKYINDRAKKNSRFQSIQFADSIVLKRMNYTAILRIYDDYQNARYKILDSLNAHQFYNKPYLWEM